MKWFNNEIPQLGKSALPTTYVYKYASCSLTWASCTVHISTKNISDQFILLPIFMPMTLFRDNPLRWAATGISLLQMNLVWILSMYAAAAIVVSIAHYGTKLVSSLREYPESSEWRICSDDRFYRWLPVDTNINRHLVHLGTFIHVSFASMRKTVQDTGLNTGRLGSCCITEWMVS